MTSRYFITAILLTMQIVIIIPEFKKRGSFVRLGNIFDKHVKYEFEDKDVESTMKTMVREPYVHHEPVMTGGAGYNNVFNFYKNDFIGKMPNDVKITRILAQLEGIRL